MNTTKETDYTDLPENALKGYDIDQLRYRRAYMLARCEIEKIKILSRYEGLRDNMPSFKGSGVASRMLKGLSYMDYAYLAYRTISKLVKITGKFRHKKK